MNTQTIKFLNQLRNASFASNENVTVSYSKSVLRILLALYKEGFVQSFKVLKSVKTPPKIRVHIRYYYNKPVFKKLKIVSSPSKSLHLNYHSIVRLNNKREQFFFSTSKGILTALDCKYHNLGGTLLFIC